MSIKIMYKLVIPFATAITLAVGFTLLVSAPTQARPDLVDVVSGGNYRFLRWGNGFSTSGSVFVLAELGDDPTLIDPVVGDVHLSESSNAADAIVDKPTEKDVDEQSDLQNSASEPEADEASPLVAVKTVSAEEAHPGEVISYTITLTNTSDVGIEASLKDYLPDGLTELSLLICNYGEASFAQRTVSWSGTVLTDTPAVISWHVAIAKGAEGEIINYATVTDPFDKYDTNSVIVKITPYIKYLPVVVN